MAAPARVIARRLIVGAVLVVQAALLVRGITSDHQEFAFRMFPEASDWKADIVQVTDAGDRAPIDEGEWARLVPQMAQPSVRQHADAGVANQLAFFRSALDWVARRTGAHLEATVTYWRNTRGPTTVVYRSHKP